MRRRNVVMFSGFAVVLAAVLMVGCGSNGGSTSVQSTQTAMGSVVTFGTDAPICDVESFSATITSASLVPQGGGTAAALISSTAPATVDFARLVDFNNILSIASSVPAGTYSQLQMTLTSPQLIALNTSTNPPSPQTDSGNPDGHNLHNYDQSRPGRCRQYHQRTPVRLQPAQIAAS